jgi:hypothetical protein
VTRPKRLPGRPKKPQTLPDDLSAVGALTPWQYSKIFKVHIETVRRNITAGTIPVVEITKKNRVIPLTPAIRAALPAHIPEQESKEQLTSQPPRPVCHD